MEVQVKNTTNCKKVNPDKPAIENLCFSSGENVSGVSDMHKIIFILTGQCEIISNIYPSFRLSAKQSVFAPAGTHFQVSFNEKCRIVVIRLDPFCNLYGFYTIEELYQELSHLHLPDKAGILNIDTIINQYFDTLLGYMESGLNDAKFYDIKTKELLLILGKSHTKQELCHFFKHILNRDSVFVAFILNNWKKIQSTSLLVQESGYTQEEFTKKFEDKFGTSLQKWVKEKKAMEILSEIIHTYKPLTLISKEYNFDSQEQFNEYCVANFNQTPECLRGES